MCKGVVRALATLQLEINSEDALVPASSNKALKQYQRAVRYVLRG